MAHKANLKKLLTKPSVLEAEPFLYILMRSDMESLNPGKACAQATHAANQFVYDVNKLPPKDYRRDLHKFWQQESGRGFGTVIVLDVGDQQNLRDTLRAARDITDCLSGIMQDDTYPLRDGKTLHLLPVQTCGYVFFDRKNNLKGRELLYDFKLMK